MPYETKEELLALAKIDPELDAVSIATIPHDISANHADSFLKPTISPRLIMAILKLLRKWRTSEQNLH
jgi:hypothetical protein